jgi:endonuclease/exonuclease/phosphatase family metal-dependent hydrolase
VDLLRVLSYNVQGHAARRRESHLKQIASVIQDARPDLVGLQEVHCRTSRSRGVDQASSLSEMTGLGVHFGRSCSIAGGDYGNAMLSRGTIVKATEHALPGAGEARSVLESVVEIDSRRIRFLVTHLSLSKDRRRRPRFEQIEFIRRLVEQGKLPTVLVGDFNVTPRSPEIVMLLESQLLQISGETREVTHRLARRRIDYILTDEHWETERAGVLRVGPSDHWPLFAELRLKQGSNRNA